MKSITRFSYILFLSTWCFAQNPNRFFHDINQSNEGLEIRVSDGTYLIKFYNANMVETSFIPKGEDYSEKSHAVILKPQEVEIIPIIEEGKSIFFTKGIEVTVHNKPFQITYSYKGEPIVSEKMGYIKNDSLETIQFNLEKDEAIYGGGARALGMNRRGSRLQLYNKAHYGYETHSELMNFTLPIVLSSKKYILHFDNAPIGFLDLDSKKDNTLSYETISGRKTYQIITGQSWYDIIENYTHLTGKQPMPPRWALGNFSSRFGYHSQKETEATIKKFKESHIPVDAVILDLYWFGKDLKGTMGNLEVFKDSFPDFEGMTKRFKDQGVKTVAITEPFILNTSKRWQEAVNTDILAKDSLGNPFTYEFYFGHTGLIDIYKPEAKKWFWNIYKKEIISKGVDGIWGDLGEPEVHPSSLIHETGSADEVHNTYGHDWAGLVYEGYQHDFPSIRPFILMRAGYSGSQRFGLIPWSGDVNRTWGGLQSQPEIVLQMGMQGLAYMHSDLGGFAGANLDDELYIRWLQYGVFQPIYRPHAQEEVPSEPVYRSEKAKALAKQAIELRYKLLPYNYNLVYENHRYGKPLMRPLFFEDDNEMLLNYSKTYFWGDDFLVAPILEASKEAQEVYFPKNSTWFDFYTNEKMIGGQTKQVKTNIYAIPTYIRAGAFIPMAKPMQNTEEYHAERIEIHYYFDSSIEKSKREFYNDDGKTPDAFKKGQYEILQFEAELEKHILEITFEAKTGANYQNNLKQVQLVIHNIHNTPKKIKVGGKGIDPNWDSQKKILELPVVWETSKRKKINIKFKK